MEFLKKISTSTMGLGVRQLEEVAESNKPKAVSVLRIWGIVSNRKPGVSQYGSYTKYTGEIAATNLITGVDARSQELLLPGIAEAVVNKMFEGCAKEGGSAQIALEITVTYNPPKSENSTFTKFSYGVKPLIEFKGEDALSAMAKLLPAPVVIAVPNGKATKK
jgi:hypothetical protein